MQSTSLYAIKTNIGYGLFQNYSKTANVLMLSFCLIYNMQVEDITNFSIDEIQKAGYYYQRISDGKLHLNPLEEDTISKEVIVTDILELNNNNILYLGKYQLPSDVVLPRYTREVEYYYRSGTYKWFIIDEESCVGSALTVNGKAISYKKLNPIIAEYPKTLPTGFKELRERFNKGFMFKDFNDESVKQSMEERYMREPNLRPIKVQYEKVKQENPVKSWRSKILDDKHIKFCDHVEKLLFTFEESIEKDKGRIKNSLVVLMKGLNELEKDTNLVCTVEAEDLFEYIAKILNSIKKSKLIDTVEELREW